MALFLPTLKQKNYLEQVNMTLCSVGSRKLGSQNDFGSQTWGLFAPHLTIYGFDADPDACEVANDDLEARQVNWTEQHFPLAIAKQVGEATLYVTNDPVCSSLYPPNEPYLKRFIGLAEKVSLDFSIELETTTLDTFFQAQGVDTVDFIQIDVQGANLQVLEGARGLLERSVLAIQVEVEFSPLYLEQPLFTDVDTFLRQHGFVLFDFSPIFHKSRSLIYSSHHPGQLLWADAIYLRDPIQAETGTFYHQPDQILKLACIADALEFTDYALELLEYLTTHYGDQGHYNYADAIALSLSTIPGLTIDTIEALPTFQAIQPFLTQPLTSLLQESTTTTQSSTFAPPVDAFHLDHYLRNNQRRLEHLASLGLDLAHCSVLEVGAGIGDHTSFFLDRSCEMVVTEGRPENLEILKNRYPNLPIQHLDLNEPDPDFEGNFNIVYCYGLLYHLHQPEAAIAFMAHHCDRLLLLETSIAFGDHEAIYFCEEPAASPTQSISGQGCRPTRAWVFNQLKHHFPHVYMPLTQPWHEEFPLDWSIPPTTKWVRSIFIASRQALDNPLLVETIPMQQRRH